MDDLEARTFRAAYGAAVQRYSKMSKAALAREENALMTDRGMERLYGGPFSKDEYLSSVLELRGYTIARMNEATHVIAHETPWPDCGYCQAATARPPLSELFMPSGTGWPVP